LFIKSTPTYPTTLCHFVAHNSHKHFLNHTTFTYKNNNNNNNKYVARPSFPAQSNGGFKRFIFPYLKKEKKKKKEKRRAIYRCEEMSVEK
jgi:hypothetical protein